MKCHKEYLVMSKHKMLQTNPKQKLMSFDKKRWRLFGDWLKVKRESANLSQDGLADLIGMDRQTIYRIENAVNGTKRETVLTLAKALNADENEALRMAGFAPQTGKDSPLVNLGLRFDKLPQSRQEKYQALIRVMDEMIEQDEREVNKQGS